MTTAVNPDDYCKDPSKYVNILKDDTIKSWNMFCDAKKSSKDKNTGGTSIEDIGKAVPAAILKMIQSMLTPEGLGMLGAYFGVNLAVKAIYSRMVETIALNISKELSQSGAKMIADGLSEAAVNISTVFVAMIEKFIFEELTIGGLYACKLLLDAVGWIGEVAIPFLGEAMMLFQLLGMIFDGWDPCALNFELDDKAIDTFNTSFDNVFRENILRPLTSVTDVYGNVYFFDLWPIEFYADNSFLVNDKPDVYGPILAQFMTKWLCSQRTNSYGQPIAWPKGGKLIDNSVLAQFERSAVLDFTNNNKVVANWAIRFMPIILLIIFFILLFIIFVLIKK